VTKADVRAQRWRRFLIQYGDPDYPCPAIRYAAVGLVPHGNGYDDVVLTRPDLPGLLGAALQCAADPECWVAVDLDTGSTYIPELVGRRLVPAGTMVREERTYAWVLGRRL
jgi:hypothetical protein